MTVRFIAQTPYEKSRGLMFSRPLERNEIAIFKYDKDTNSGFWNKNVGYPIKIIFFDKLLNVVDIKRLKSNQTEIVKPKRSYRYAVEAFDRPLTLKDLDLIRTILVNIK